MSKHRLRVQRFVQMHEKEPQVLYLTAVPAATLVQRHAVDFFDSVSKTGYQRAPNASRFKPIARYVRKDVGMLPSSVLLNIRSGATFEPDVSDPNYGWLHLDDEEKWWVIDGQHRVKGLDAALQDGKPLNYEVPVTFCIGFDALAEMRLFHVVNAQQKGVPYNLAAELIAKQVDEQRAEDTPVRVSLLALRKAAGVAVADYLKTADGPWQGHIQSADESKDVKTKPLMVNTIAATLRPVFSERWVQAHFLEDPNDLHFERISKLVAVYWKALAELMPDAFAAIEHYNVQRPVGVYTFHAIMPEILDHCRLVGDYSQKTMQDDLLRLDEWVDSKTWHRDDGEDIVKGNNRAAINVIVERMREAYKFETTGIDD